MKMKWKSAEFTIFSQQILSNLVIIDYNLNLLLKLLFFLTYNNLLLKICCESIVNITFFFFMKCYFKIYCHFNNRRYP